MLRGLVRRQRRGSARWVAAAATLVLTAAVGSTVASPAHAETLPITDDFENGGWTTGTIPGKTDAFIGSLGPSHSGTEHANLDAHPHTPAMARVFRSITLNNGAPLPPRTCRAGVWIRTSTGHVQVLLTVHSGGPTGRIISSTGRDVDNSGWAQMTFEPIPWPADSRTITVEIAAYRGIAAADDFTFSC
ncbi:hypothetical protein [Paractinoplanes rishiriensis]|uniref:Secreted protein n=1 Tax=Paractinoplanes rishiriensis TaxID=1050105 RepID=A0A919K8Y2_9ACTN|nr:hypothetical protein [Actinoplanes rishiriensis]GIF02209.1 hypothetical protein Ari01nite_96730 [Actinoplanes rishiriensis]